MRKNDSTTSHARADERYCEALSTLLDDECHSMAQVLDDTVSSTECKAKWQSYHLIRDVLQSECHAALPSNFASIVSERIAEEENIAAVDGGDRSADVIPLGRTRGASRVGRSERRGTPAMRQQSPRWLPFAGLGLAASVAAAGFVGWQVVSKFDPSTSSQAQTVAQLSAPTASAPRLTPSVVPQSETGLVRTVYRSDAGTRWVAVSDNGSGNHDAKVAQRLNALLLNHMEDASMSRVQGMVAHTRLVGYDTGSVDGSF